MELSTQHFGVTGTICFFIQIQILNSIKTDNWSTFQHVRVNSNISKAAAMGCAGKKPALSWGKFGTLDRKKVIVSWERWGLG